MTRNETRLWLRARRVAVLYGGVSAERSISLKTGRAVLAGFRRLGIRAAAIDAGPDLPDKIRRYRPGFCFIALHGRMGEDGTVQGLCEVLGVPYSGSGVLASAMAMDKEISKKMFLAAGLPTAPFRIFSRADVRGPAPLPVSPPLVVKPVDGGSAIGVSVVRKAAELGPALRRAFRRSGRILVEKFVSGVEVTAPVLGRRALPLIEIVPKSSFYDFRAKYVKGMSDHILPARLSARAQKRVKDLALAAHQVLGCRAFSRVDFIVDARDRAWILELNSIPGMTETSLFPEAARAAGLSFEDMLLEMVRHSLTAS